MENSRRCYQSNYKRSYKNPENEFQALTLAVAASYIEAQICDSFCSPTVIVHKSLRQTHGKIWEEWMHQLSTKTM
jgi:hypothetical protein